MTESEPTCFIAMPITTSKEVAERYDDPDHWSHVMEELFVPAIEAAGFTPLRPVSKGSEMIHGAIIQQLSEADMVLVDLSEHNPNVFFELGVRTSVNKPVAVVRSQGTQIPFDTSGMNTPEYDATLRTWGIKQAVADLAEHLQNAVTSCGGENPMWRQFGLTIKAEEPTSDATPVEAKIELLAESFEQLRGDMRLLSRKAQIPRAYTPNDDMVATDSTRRYVADAIGDLASQRGLDVRVEWSNTDDEVLVLIENEASGSTVKRFSHEVQGLLANTSWTPNVLLRDPSFPRLDFKGRSTRI